MKIHVYSIGLCAASVCAPKEMPLDQITKQLNELHPTGMDNDWEKDPAPQFRQGGTNPCVCEKDPERMHYLFTC